MLVPKKVKHRKWHRLTRKGGHIETRGTRLSYGSFGLKATTEAFIDSRQIEAARRTISNYIKREGKVWIRVFPDQPVTKHPPEVTMGGGKGAVDHYHFKVKPGRILFEMDGVPESVAREALRLAGFKLPVRTMIITK